MRERVVAAFDFDGTITRRDTFLPFLRRYGVGKLTKASCKTLVDLKNGDIRNRLKENALSELFGGYPTKQLEIEGRAYASTIPNLYRREILKRIEFHKHQNHLLVLVTGSLGCYARPAGEALGFDHIIAVEMTSSLGCLTGKMEGVNVRGPEKARRLRMFLGIEDVELWAYGNSSGDKEMLEMAGEVQVNN